MKNSIYLLIIITIISCNNPSKETDKQPLPTNNSYDEVLANKYGADQYGMKKYVIAFLKRGLNRSQDSITKNRLQRAHLDNINKLAKEGKLVLAGPFFGNDDLRGIYIFNVTTIEEAEELTNSDPAIIAGSLIMELKEWYGSAALMMINEAHKKLAKTEILKKAV